MQRQEQGSIGGFRSVKKVSDLKAKGTQNDIVKQEEMTKDLLCG